MLTTVSSLFPLAAAAWLVFEVVRVVRLCRQQQTIIQTLEIRTRELENLVRHLISHSAHVVIEDFNSQVEAAAQVRAKQILVERREEKRRRRLAGGGYKWMQTEGEYINSDGSRSNSPVEVSERNQ